MEVYNCFNTNEQYEYFHDGECLTTPAPCIETACPEDDKPICGQPDGSCGDPKTFANECYMKVYNNLNPNNKYKYFHDKACLNEPKLDCDSIVCTEEYMPFCTLPDGSCGDILQFSNQCEFDVFNCKNPDTKYKYFHQGECLTTPAPEPNCAAISCSNEGPAVCGVPDGSSGPAKTFTNGCNMKVYNCFNPDAPYTFASQGECHECATFCPLNYDPICSVNSAGNEKQWSNQCGLDNYNCNNPSDQYTVAYQGGCHQCVTACIDNYDPVCSYDSNGAEKQWPNQCELDNYNCKNPNDQCSIAYQGECNNCRLGCPKIYNPVCALDSEGNELPYGNQCMLDSYNCMHKNGEQTIAHEGECNKCSTMCPAIYKPICIKDSAGIEKTLGNDCELSNYNCRYPQSPYTLQYQGECKPNCLKPCPKILAQICGKDEKRNLKTFSNSCEMDNYNCQHPDSKFTKSYSGACKPVCQDVCADIYKPVCGSSNGNCKNSDAKTFPNQCEFDSYNCHNPTKVLIKAADGKCPAIL